ncbi:chain length determinant protein [Pontibacter vulgaris]|uniref:chain length determinant protein n=1 Tax=Pontibacter vulgaris TaxID=2905679 RepID=UPI001FA7C464|nr:chain length determinant protein [Pontibacter vulgaris]
MQHLKDTEDRRKYNAPDEIDLLSIFRFFNRQANKLSRKIKNIIHDLVSNLLTVLALVIVGLGLGFSFYYVTKPYYKSSMTLVLADIRNDFVEDQLNKLSVMIAEDNFEAVAQRLDITPTAAKEIKQMSFSNLDQERIEEDSVLTGSPFRIELLLYDNKLFDSMEPALANFLENNRYFSKQKRIRQRQVENLIARYKNDIASIDSVKSEVASPRGPVNGFVYGEPIDPSNLYREGISMYQQQVQLEAELDQLDNIQVVTGFSPRSKPTGPNLLKFLAVGGFSAFLVGLIVAVRIEKKKARL